MSEFVLFMRQLRYHFGNTTPVPPWDAVVNDVQYFHLPGNRFWCRFYYWACVGRSSVNILRINQGHPFSDPIPVVIRFYVSSSPLPEGSSELLVRQQTCQLRGKLRFSKAALDQGLCSYCLIHVAMRRDKDWKTRRHCFKDG